MSDLEPFMTSDTPLAAYLHMKGMVVLSTKPDPEDPKRRIAFIFLDEPERTVYVDEWFTVDRHFADFYRSLRELQRLIFAAKERNDAK